MCCCLIRRWFGRGDVEGNVVLECRGSLWRFSVCLCLRVRKWPIKLSGSPAPNLNYSLSEFTEAQHLSFQECPYNNAREVSDLADMVRPRQGIRSLGAIRSEAMGRTSLQSLRKSTFDMGILHSYSVSIVL